MTSRQSGLRSVFSSLLVILVVGCSNGSDNSTPATPWPGGVWAPAPASYGMTVERDIPVTMDDGVILHANVGYPTQLGNDVRAAGTFPILLSHNPYAGGAEPDAYFVSRGYIHVVAEVRGTQESELSAENPDGPLVTDSRGRREGRDGANLVHWSANLDGGNGKVGLYGCSWLGINQILTVGELESMSPVKAMIPACAGQDYNTFFSGGVATAVVGYFNLAGSILGTKHLPENVVDGTVLKDDILAGGERSLDHQYWQDRSSYTRMSKIVADNIPTLLFTGWRALEGVTGGVDLFSDLQNAASGRPVYGPMEVGRGSPSGKFQIIVSSGEHGGDIDKTLQLLWYDTWLKGQDTRVDETTTGMHLYEIGADRWINHATWPITDDYTAFYLTDAGLDSIAQTYNAQITFGDPAEPGTTLSYESQPLAADRTLAGPVAATLYIRSSNTDAHFVLSLYDVAPDGSTTEVSRGSLIASLLDLSPDRSWYDANGLVLKPQGKYVERTLLVPNTLARLDIKLFPTLRRISAGHSFRLVVGTQAKYEECNGALDLGWPRPCLFNAVQGPALAGGQYEIVSDATHPSSLNLPLVDPASLMTARSGFTETSPEQSQPLDWGSRTTH